MLQEKRKVKLFFFLDKNDLLIIVAFSIAFVVGLLLLSDSTSPLYPYSLGADSSIFSLLGKGMTEGRELYTGLFDHKGPVIFFVNAMGHLLGGRTGIFIMQCLSGILYISILYFTYKSIRSCESGKKLLYVSFLFVAGLGYFFYTFEGGNLTEEYSLPFIALPLLLFTRYLLGTEEKVDHPPLYSFLYGICFSILAFTRLNNAITIGAGVLFIIAYLLYHKRYRNILVNFLYGFLGILLITLPIIIYFGVHSSLEEMIYATFLHNFQIFEKTGHSNIFANPLLYAKLFFPIVCCGVLLITHLCKQRKITSLDGLLITVLLANIIVLLIANRFPHYFLIFAPVYCIFLFRYAYFTKRNVCSLLAVLCILVHLSVAGNMKSIIKTNYFENDMYTRYHTVSGDMSHIPMNERDSVIGYEIEAADYLRGDILPCYKYYTLQETWGITNPQIVSDFVEWVDTEKPTWIITNIELNNKDLMDILNREYELQFENEYLLFYRITSFAD